MRTAKLDSPLTEREIEIMQLIVGGRTRKQLAEELKISVHTVKFHVDSVHAKLGVSTTIMAVVKFMTGEWRQPHEAKAKNNTSRK